jgi:hypothetical protein
MAAIEAHFVVRDSGGHKLGYLYFDDPRSADKPLIGDEARRNTVNMARGLKPLIAFRPCSEAPEIAQSCLVQVRRWREQRLRQASAAL